MSLGGLKQLYNKVSIHKVSKGSILTLEEALPLGFKSDPEVG